MREAEGGIREKKSACFSYSGLKETRDAREEKKKRTRSIRTHATHAYVKKHYYYDRYSGVILTKDGRTISRRRIAEIAEARIARAIGGGEITSCGIALALEARYNGRAFAREFACVRARRVYERQIRGRDKERRAVHLLVYISAVSFSPCISPLATFHHSLLPTAALGTAHPRVRRARRARFDSIRSCEIESVTKITWLVPSQFVPSLLRGVVFEVVHREIGNTVDRCFRSCAQK